MTVEETTYKNFSKVYRVSNGEVELLLVADVGPRILRFGFVGGQNLFKEMTAEEEKFLTEGQDWRLYGGHRIWVGPEEPSYTYAADNEQCDVVVSASGVKATAPADPVGIQKQIEVSMSDSGEVIVAHRLTNKNAWPLRYCAWALTMMAKGGVGVSTFPPRGTHPEILAPTNPLVMFAFTNLSDVRWKILEKYIVLRQDPNVSDPEKIGLFNPRTRGAYLLGSDLFVKKFEPEPGGEYPDMGSSFETFTNDLFLELETLGPIHDVAPNETVEHTETWTLHKDVSIERWTDRELDRVLAPYLD